MIILRRKLDISDFFNLCDLSTAQGQEEFERILNYMRQQLYTEIPSALDKELNKLGNEDFKYDNYVIEYKKENWDAKRLYEEIHKYPYIDGKYQFRGNLYRPDHFEELVLNRKPFDLYLFVKTMEEYEKEEIEKRYKRSV